MDKKEEIRTHIKSILIKNGKRPDFSDNDSLVVSGLLDSLAILELLSFIEDQFGVDFAERGFDQNDFDTLNTITSMITSMDE